MAYERMFSMYADDPTVSEIIELMAAEMRSPGGVGQSPPSVRGWSISELRAHDGVLREHCGIPLVATSRSAHAKRRPLDRGDG
jgi:hypothetical protein